MFYACFKLGQFVAITWLLVFCAAHTVILYSIYTYACIHTCVCIHALLVLCVVACTYMMHSYVYTSCILPIITEGKVLNLETNETSVTMVTSNVYIFSSSQMYLSY